MAKKKVASKKKVPTKKATRKRAKPPKKRTRIRGPVVAKVSLRAMASKISPRVFSFAQTATTPAATVCQDKRLSSKSRLAFSIPAARPGFGS